MRDSGLASIPVSSNQGLLSNIRARALDGRHIGRAGGHMRSARRRQRKRKRGGHERHERHRHQRVFNSDAIGQHADKRHARPPMPQAKPIISDDTVAALMGAIIWPKVTLTGSVDCSRKPPIATTRHERPSGEERRRREERHRADERPA